MFEKDIKETIQQVTREILQDRTLVSLEDILQDKRIPNRLKAFFENEVHAWIEADSLSRRRDRRFDYADPEMTSLLDYLRTVQSRHARFERDEFIATLDAGVKLTYNYICRPQTTLKWFIFRGEPTRPLAETLLRMSAFLDYPYFYTVFSEWVERKKEERPVFDSISSREFERIIRRIDDQILLSCTIDELLEIMDPLFSFLGEGEDRRVPIEIMIVYFDDKKITRLVDFLDDISRTHEYVTPESFARLIEDLLVEAEDEPEADFSSVYQEDELDDVVRRHLSEEEVAEAPQQQPAEVLPQESQGVEEEKREEIAEDSGEEESTESRGEESREEPEERGEPTAVEEKIEKKLKKKILKKIFDREKEEYRRFLEKIESADSWREASILLDRLFRSKNIDPYSRTAIDFTDAVYGSFIRERDEVAG